MAPEQPRGCCSMNVIGTTQAMLEASGCVGHPHYAVLSHFSIVLIGRKGSIGVDTTVVQMWLFLREWGVF